MIGVVLGLMTYFISNTGHFGGDILKALSVVETWYWIVFYIWAGCCVLVSLVAAGALANEFGEGVVRQFAGIVTGSTFGIFLAILLMFKVVVQLFIVNGLTDSIDPMSDNLTSKEIFGLVLLFFISLLHRSSKN